MKFFTKSLTRSYLLMICFLASQALAVAQRTITGIVKDKNNGEPLIGANVIVKEDRTKGAATDFDGKFTIKVPDNAATLIFSYTGYETMEQGIVGINTLEVEMSDGTILKDVVVIGYGTVKREDATGLVQSVSTDRFNKGAIASPQQLLAGKVAGVTITTDGSPGGGSKIRVRGESSLSASNDPLIVIDGVPIDNGGVSGSRNVLNMINPNDIESFTVLKDASAAAIYGNRASAGVILITTKKGQLGRKISVGYSGNVSIGQRYNQVDVLTADEFRQTVTSQFTNPDPTKPPHPSLALLGSANTDWQNEIYQNAFGTDHSLNISGGIGVVPYRVSIGFTDADGLLKTDNFKRYTSAINLNPKFLNNTLQWNINFKGSLSDNHFADRGAIGSALSFDPTKPVRSDTSSQFGGFTTWTLSSNGTPNGLAPANPVALLELRDDNSTVKQYILNTSVDYRFPFLPALRANVNVGYNHSYGEGTISVPNYAAFAFDAINGGGVNNIYNQTKDNSLFESYLNYKKNFGRHGVDVMGGYSWQHFKFENYFKNSDSAGTLAEVTEGTDESEYYLLSLFSRLNYSFNDRYLFTASIRRDGTSRFDPRYRWGIFPAAAFAVKIIENNHKTFNSLKLRTSWGHTGQQDIGDNYYAYLPAYVYGQPNAQYQFGNNFVGTIRPNGYVANIKWEETDSYNAGLDFSIVRDRLSGTLDLYSRDTKDLLNYINVAALTNLTNFVTQNIGNMKSRGAELSLNFTPIVKNKVRWDISTNFARNISEITKLTLGKDSTYVGVLTGGIAGGVGSNIQVHSVGFMPNSFYVFEQLYAEDGSILEGQFADRNQDGIVNELDKYRFNNPNPQYTVGLSSNLNAGNFDFSFGARSNIGQYVYNNVQTDMGYLNRLFGSSGYLSNVNQSAVDLNVLDQGKLTFSDHFVTKATFFRVDHITAGYTFNNVVGKNLRVYTTVQNPLVVTKYEGLDPEIGSGIDNNIYPRPRTYVFGLSVNF